MRIINRNGSTVAVIDKEEKINGIRHILDLIAEAGYFQDCYGIVFHQDSLGDSFFDLKTGYAGEILQKFSNYRMRAAIIGDFDRYQSKSLQAFIRECNRGNCVFFKKNEEDGISELIRC